MRFTVNQGRTLENKKKELSHKQEGPSNKAVEPLKPVQAVIETPGKAARCRATSKQCAVTLGEPVFRDVLRTVSTDIGLHFCRTVSPRVAVFPRTAAVFPRTPCRAGRV
jgi:hypothetical protein